MTIFKIENKNRLPALTLLASYKYKHMEDLYLQSDRTITTQVTRLLKDIASIKALIIRSPMTRTALRDCFSIKGLESLNVFELVTPGKLIDASKAIDLKSVNCRSSSDVDLRVFSKLPHLTEMIAHHSKWSLALLERFISKPLTRLEVEDSYMSDEMVALIANSNTIVDLSIGNSGLTGKGLAKIAQMQQLQSLDIWNTKVDANDLASLMNLQNLTYLSIGGNLGQQYLDMEKAVSYLLQLPNLSSLWIDGVMLTDNQLTHLKQHIKTVRYDFDDDE